MSGTISRLVRALPLAIVVGILALPGPAPAGDATPFRNGDFLALNTRGTAKNISTDPMRTVFEFDLYSLATGERIGTAQDDVFCSTTTPPPCQVFDAITTFRLPDGELVNHAQVSVVPDPQRPGWFLVASPPVEGNIIRATGAYAGRTGGVGLTGVNEGSNYPNELTVDDRWVIELD